MISWLESGLWIAQRRDDYKTIRAEDPYALRQAIRADYLKCPVSRRIFRSGISGGARSGRGSGRTY